MKIKKLIHMRSISIFIYSWYINKKWQYLKTRKDMKSSIYCLCLLEREWPLTKPDFPIIGNSTQETFLFANPKTKFYKYILIQKEQIVQVYIQKQKHGWGTVYSSRSMRWEYSVSQPQKKSWILFSKTLRKGSRVGFFWIRECENSPPCIACMPQLWVYPSCPLSAPQASPF